MLVGGWVPRLVPERIYIKAILHFKPHFLSLAHETAFSHTCLNGTTHQWHAVGNETNTQGQRGCCLHLGRDEPSQQSLEKTRHQNNLPKRERWGTCGSTRWRCDGGWRETPTAAARKQGRLSSGQYLAPLSVITPLSVWMWLPLAGTSGFCSSPLIL